MSKRNSPIDQIEPTVRQAVVYARVSSKEQEKEGYSIPAQLKLLKDYAAQEGFAVVQEYVDVETAKTAGRASFGDMVAYLRAHPSVRVLMAKNYIDNLSEEARKGQLEKAAQGH